MKIKLTFKRAWSESHNPLFKFETPFSSPGWIKLDTSNLVSIGGSWQALHRVSKISSSAVAKMPRDASCRRFVLLKLTTDRQCLSVVSLNSTKRRVESFIVSYVR